jgi:hypothetical protein
VPRGIWREISALTDHAALRVDGVEHRKEERVLVIPISRVPFVEREKLLGGDTKRSYGKERIPSEIRIGHVVRCRIEKNIPTGQQEIQLERGLTAEGKKVFLFSLNEHQGKLFFSLEAEVDLFDITISDSSPE